jgi:hypothetical protein
MNELTDINDMPRRAEWALLGLCWGGNYNKDTYTFCTDILINLPKKAYVEKSSNTIRTIH